MTLTIEKHDLKIAVSVFQCEDGFFETMQRVENLEARVVFSPDDK
jgi:hypothetical protein